jgi:streptomycin 6-kinase
MTPVTIPDLFARTIADLHGDAGHDWVAQLPSIIREHARAWSLTVLPSFEPLSYNYVAPAIRADGTHVVLKAGFPTTEFSTEIDALGIYDGRGAVRLLEVDREHSIMLLEMIRPGTSLAMERDDRRRTSAAADLMCRLWRPVPDGYAFPSVAQWGMGLQRLRERFNGGTGPLPAPLVDTAERLFAELLASMAEPVLLHGDLHHGNILASESERWLAIDPKGVIGEPVYEIGALLRNPWPELLAEENPGRILARRVDQFAEELGFDRERIVGWGIAQGVLSAWWSIEDHEGGWEWSIACAKLLAGI